MNVQTADGDSLGTVSSVEGNYVVVTSGALLTNTLFVPVNAIAQVDASEVVHLDMDSQEVRAAGWDEMPEDFRAGASVPEVPGRDNLEAAAERVPGGRSATAAMRDGEPTA